MAIHTSIKVIGGLVAFTLSTAVMINLSDNSPDAKIDRYVKQLVFDYNENDQEMAKMFIATKACKTNMPANAAQVLNKYVAARGKDLEPQLSEARKLLSNPFMMALGCPAVQGIVNSYNS